MLCLEILNFCIFFAFLERIVEAKKRLARAIRAKTLTRKIDRMHGDKKMAPHKRDLAIMGWEGAKDHDLLRNRQYNEAALQKKHEQMERRLDVNGLSFAPRLRQAAMQARNCGLLASHLIFLKDFKNNKGPPLAFFLTYYCQKTKCF